MEAPEEVVDHESGPDARLREGKDVVPAGLSGSEEVHKNAAAAELSLSAAEFRTLSAEGEVLKRR